MDPFFFHRLRVFIVRDIWIADHRDFRFLLAYIQVFRRSSLPHVDTLNLVMYPLYPLVL
jgi:hypothetical protein